MSEELKFSLTAAEAAAKRRVARIQILQGDSQCFKSKNPVLLSGEWAYERDTGKLKIGDGVTPWNKLAYKVDQTLDSNMVQVIHQAEEIIKQKGQPLGYAGLDADGKISRSQLPADINATTVVRTISDMESIPSVNRYMGFIVLVLDASADDTVRSGAATYVWTGDKWEKISEAESMDIDESVFFLKSRDTLDDIIAGDKHLHFTRQDRAKLNSIEEGATSDLTTQEIAAMYEGLNDVNRFTDELRKKLEEIEDGATNDSGKDIRDKLSQLPSGQRLNADFILSGDANRFFTDKERKELDDILAKLRNIEDGATSDTPEQIREKLESLASNKLLNADFIKDGSRNKFVTPEQIENIKKIDQIRQDIARVQGQIGNLSEQWVKDFCDEKSSKMAKECDSKLKAITSRLDALDLYKQSTESDIYNLNHSLKNLEDSLKGIESRVAKLEQFQTEINNIINERISKLEFNLGDISVNLKNDIFSSFNDKLADELEKLETTINSQLHAINALFTPTEIKRLYEANPNTNPFTDDDQAKLAGIEPNADVTNHSTVRNAGGLMEGDILFGGDCATMF